MLLHIFYTSQWHVVSPISSIATSLSLQSTKISIEDRPDLLTKSTDALLCPWLPNFGHSNLSTLHLQLLFT